MKLFILCFFAFLGGKLISQDKIDFFKKLSKQSNSLTSLKSNKKWLWRPNVALPALKSYFSNAENTILDTYIFTSTGGGISYQRTFEDPNERNRYVNDISFSPITILVSGDFKNASPVNLAYMSSIGIANNSFMLGIGYDLGKVDEDRNRFFITLNIGINFNN